MFFNQQKSLLSFHVNWIINYYSLKPIDYLIVLLSLISVNKQSL